LIRALLSHSTFIKPETQLFLLNYKNCVEFLMTGGGTARSIPEFLNKTFTIFSCGEHSDCCAWHAGGETIVVKKLEIFSNQVLPKYFRHSNFQSWWRQLNMYDFHKTSNSGHSSYNDRSGKGGGSKESNCAAVVSRCRGRGGGEWLEVQAHWDTQLTSKAPYIATTATTTTTTTAATATGGC
jgi:hypothetical protein